MGRKPYPSDVSDDEWALVAPYVTLMTEDAPQREHSVREVFHDLRWMVRAGAAWRMMLHDVLPWHTVYQQSQRWFKASVFDLRQCFQTFQPLVELVTIERGSGSVFATAL